MSIIALYNGLRLIIILTCCIDSVFAMITKDASIMHAIIVCILTYLNVSTAKVIARR
jgi:hypothetical protein